MQNLITFNFPGTGYSPHFYHCSHPGGSVRDMAAKVWAEATGVGSPRLPFEQGHGVEREVTAEEIKVLRKLFMHRLDWTKRYHTPEEFENIVADDRVFLELSEIGTRWDTSSSIVMIFELAKLMDPTITYESLKRYASVSLY